jgi:cation transport protein ChaC
MLTRESIKNGVIQRMIEAQGGLVPSLSEEELVASWQQSLAAAPEGDPWVFGYGSLIWNPAFHFADRKIARLYGYHRQFSLWTHLGRGTPDNPGMVLGLVPRGSCTGVAFRVRRDQAEEEFDIIWRREMVSGAYRPIWTRVHTGAGPVPALTFVINPEHPRFAGDVPEERVIRALATACGPLGRCADYLLNTVEHLEEMDIRDRTLDRLTQGVKALCRERGLPLRLDPTAA